MPGWERGSLGVHADDGRRFVNDTEGGKDFIQPINAGETVGIGINYSIAEAAEFPPSPVSDQPPAGEVFFSRNGKLAGTWNIHEELDADNDFGVLGLDGQFDLYGAIGTFGEVGFEVFFHDRDWKYQPR